MIGGLVVEYGSFAIRGAWDQSVDLLNPESRYIYFRRQKTRDKQRNIPSEFVHCIQRGMNRSGTLHLERRPDGVFILTMKTVENRINVSFIKDLNEALDTVECSEGACALITTNESHIYCNGFDLNWVSKHLDQAQLMVQEFMKLIGRILVFPVPTIAALNGHVFAAGVFFAMAHDFRVMRSDRGFLCLPEIDLHMAITPGLALLLNCKIQDSFTIRDALLFGKRFTGEEANTLRLVDRCCPMQQVLPVALKLASSVAGKASDRKTMTDLKRELYKKAYYSLEKAEMGRAVSAQLTNAKL